MGGIQKEDGYTSVANAILENTARAKLNSTQFRIILVVWRYTYGFSRKEHDLSLSFIADAIDGDRRNVQREIKAMCKAGILSTNIDGNHTRRISFNKHFEEWKTGTSVGESANGEPANGESDNGEFAVEVLANETTQVLANQPTKKEKLKEKYKENTFEVFNFYLSLGLMKHRNMTAAMGKAIEKAMRDNKYTAEDCKELLRRHKRVIEITAANEYPVRMRGIAEFFGQKVHGATHLICSEYEEGGKYYEAYKEKINVAQTVPRKIEVVFVEDRYADR